MRLEIGTFPVHDVVFGAQTQWRDGLLEVAQDEIPRCTRSGDLDTVDIVP